VNEFLSDDKFQRAKRDTILVPFLYDRYFWERYRLLDGEWDYQSRGIDTLIFNGTGAPTHIEEKIVREKHTAFALETKSCTVEGYEKPGWMFYGEADRMLFCFTVPKGLDCWWIDFPALQQWFWPQEKNFATFQMKTRNRTAGRVVPIDAIPYAILIRNFHLPEKGSPV